MRSRRQLRKKLTWQVNLVFLRVTEANSVEARESSGGKRLKAVEMKARVDLMCCLRETMMEGCRGSRILNRHLPIFNSDPTTQFLLGQPPLVAFKRDRSLRDMVVRNRLKEHHNHRGTVPCHRPVCLTCPYVFRTHFITFPKDTFVVRESFSCVSRNIIYVIVCSRCNMQYIGETGRRLADRFREHLRDTDSQNGSPVSSHFNQIDHRGTRDMTVSGLISCSSSDRCRLSLENRLIDRLGVLAPSGINKTHSFI